MANVKVTIKEQFVEVAEVLRGVGREDLAEFIDGRIEVLNRKSENKKATAKQEANEVLKGVIVDALTDFGKAVDMETLKTAEGLGEYSTPKLASLLKQLADAGKVVKTMDGKKPFYAVA